MSKKKKKRRKRSEPYYSQKDWHHYLYVKKDWDEKYATHALRNHPYCGAYILKYTEHRAIHEAVTYVPRPPEATCQYIIHELNRMYENGSISDKDSPVRRLTTLINLCTGIAEPTAEALRAQRDALLKSRRRWLL